MFLYPHSSPICLVLLVLAVLFAAEWGHADQIRLANGQVIHGRIVSQDDHTVVIETPITRMRLNTDSIVEIRRDEPWRNTLLEAESALERRDAVRGFDLIFRADIEGAPRDIVSQVIRRQDGRISGAVREADQRRRPEIRRGLQRLVDDDMLTTPTIFLVSQHFYHLEEYDLAASTLEKIPPDDLAADPLGRTWALEFMRFQVKRQLGRGHFENALTYLEKMRRLTGETDSPQLPLAHLAHAAAARERHRYREAFQIIAEDLHPAVPEIARNRAIYTIGAMKEWASRGTRYNQAREALEPIEELYPLEYIIAYEHFTGLEAERLMQNGAAQRALEILKTVPPPLEGDILRLYNEAYHQTQMDILGEDSPMALLEHARWCFENGLLDEANHVLSRTRENPNLREVSDELIRAVNREYDVRMLERAQKAYDDGRMSEVIHITRQVLGRPDLASTLQQEAEKLDELANRAIGREQEARPYEAEALFQEAERAYFRMELEESFHLLNVVIDRYTDTPAARRAASLLAEVVRMIEIAYLEGRISRPPTVRADIPLSAVQRSERLDTEVTRLMDAIQPGL